MEPSAPITPLVTSSPVGFQDYAVGPQPSLTQPASVETLPDIDTTYVWGLNFSLVDMHDVIERADQIIASRHCKYFITANLNYLMLSAQHTDLAKVNAAADLMIADGYPIVMRSWCNLVRLPERVAGSDMIVELARLSARKAIASTSWAVHQV